jgi:hypothetical protein
VLSAPCDLVHSSESHLCAQLAVRGNGLFIAIGVNAIETKPVRYSRPKRRPGGDPGLERWSGAGDRIRTGDPLLGNSFLSLPGS